MEKETHNKKAQTFTSENLKEEINKGKPVNKNFTEANPKVNSNVTESELESLENSMTDLPGDDENVRRATLDKTDEGGTLLNEEAE